jgi:hypothetical protein
MALTPEIQAPQAGVIATFDQASQQLRVTQAFPLAVYNVPAEEVRVTYGDAHVVYDRDSQQMRITSGQVLAVVRGRIDNPKLRAWAYTLDGHDYYVLKLGTTGKTLVFDLSTQTWSWWTTSTNPNWRASIGLNWRSAGTIPSNSGSNIIVGDDSYGVLWVLDPEQGTDDALLEDDTQVTFPRVATGQMTTKARVFEPVFSVDLRASLGAPSLEANTVSLSYSDDQGQTYVVADDVKVVEEGNFAQEFRWLSMGQVRAPGRLFRLEDNGAFARIDSLDVNE